MSERYLPIDDEGYFIFDGRRVDDQELGQALLRNMRPVDKDRFVTSLQGQDAWIEAFDEPLIARHVRATTTNGVGEIDLPYSLTARFRYDSLSVDEWDRFHGVTESDLPFVFARQAQYEFFNMLDEFDDDSVTIAGHRYPVGPWLIPFEDARQDEFWSGVYQKEETPGFDLGAEAAALPSILPQLKLSKSRVLVLGCGKGHDAAYFARQGHNVTAVDFSREAIQRANALYGSIEGLKFEQHDVFALPTEWTGRFDIVFEHTLYCAIEPSGRNDLVGVWRRMLHAQGHLLGVFFAMEKRTGPPWGGSEWELRERLRKGFEFLFWTRWRHSVERRRARELVIYARKRQL